MSFKLLHALADAATKNLTREQLLEIAVKSRCLIEGCRYGYNKEEMPKDHCIYCGQPRHVYTEWEVSIIDEINKELTEPKP
jgi:hypothetical protein